MRAQPRLVESPLDVVCAALFADQRKPHRDFLVPNLIPARNVTILSGDGGTGKSLVALQLSTAIASGTLWLQTLETKTGAVLYFSAEDDLDETHIRLKDICEGENIDLATLADLHIAVMAGQDCLLATEDGKAGRMQATPLLGRLESSLVELRPTLLVLDNLADIFGGNENIKGLVRQFVGMLRGLAIRHDCTVLVLAHPSLSGMSNGSGSSGNVAWNNSVRSRLYLKRQHDDANEITDPDFRKLVTMKANYAPIGGQIGMRWVKGFFVATDRPATATGTVDRWAIGAKAERVFLDLVNHFNETRRNVSPTTGTNYAPALFAGHPSNESVTKRQFEQAMHALFQADRIEVVEVGPESRRRKNITLKVPEKQE